MTRVYFVRHAQPDHDWEEDRTRPLTEEGKKDSVVVLEFLSNKKIDAFYCSPYKRSIWWCMSGFVILRDSTLLRSVLQTDQHIL